MTQFGGGSAGDLDLRHKHYTLLTKICPLLFVKIRNSVIFETIAITHVAMHSCIQKTHQL